MNSIIFQSEYDLFVNRRNPYCFYPSTTGGPLLNLGGVYSKEKNFYITPTGYAKFYYDENASPTGIGFDYANQQSQQFWFRSPAEMNVCVSNYAEKSGVVAEENNDFELKLEENDLQLFPNPSDGSNVICEFKLLGNESATMIQLTDATGKHLHSMEVESGIELVSLNFSNLHQGLYFVSVSNGNNRIVKQLIIQK